MTTSTPSTPLFTVTFWQVAAAQIIVGIASAITGPLAAVEAANLAGAGGHVSLPWYSVAVSGAIGGLLALVHAIGGQQVNYSGPASFLPAPAAVRAPAAARRVVKRQATRQTPRTRN